MNERKQRYLVSGSSALKPDCSRHSNENEHIINFPARAITTYDLGPKRPSVRNQKSLSDRVYGVLNRSVMVNDLKKGSLKGTPYGKSSKASLAAAGAVYTLIAVAALYFGM